YKTGDLVRYLEDGTIEFLGRIDNQVKVRGFRIELQEIESQRKSYVGIQEAVVVLREDRPSDKRLIGYVVMGDAKQFDSLALQRYLRGRLPDYMIPSFIMKLDALPMTPNGKIDRKKLPAPDRENINGGYSEQLTMTEEVLVNIWADVLNMKSIARHQNFFDLGGHSLLATQLISRIRDAFNIELPLNSLFESKDLASMAEIIDASIKKDTIQVQKVHKYHKNGNVPLSFAQQRLWFLDKLHPGLTAYNIPTAIKVKGNFDLIKFTGAVKTIIRRHEALRTIFAESAGKPVQIIADEIDPDITIININAGSESQKITEAYKIAHEEIQKPFQLDKGPLFRISVMMLSGEEFVLLFVLHHIIADGWSMGILIKEITDIYNAYTDNAIPVLPDLPIQYSDYSLWQHEQLENGIYEEQLGYWKEQLKDVPPLLDLVTDHPRKAAQPLKGGNLSIYVPKSSINGLYEISRREGVTLFMTLLGAFNTLLYKYTGQHTIVVGTPIAGRVQSELENLIGFFVNTLALRTDFEINPSFKYLLASVRKMALEAYANQDVPFEKIVEELQPVRDMSHSPLFQIMFVFQNLKIKPLELSNLQISSFPLKPNSPNFDISMTIMESEEGLMINADFNAELFESETIERILNHYRYLLETLSKDPEIGIDDLQLLTGSEQKLILEKWNETGTGFSPENSVIKCFQHIAESLIDTPAVQFADSRNVKIEVTYGELNIKSDIMAVQLKKMGLGPEKIAAIAAERSVDMIVGILAILKTGAAFLPIDPSYPPERIRFMIEDSGCEMILTQSGLKNIAGGLGKDVVCIDTLEEVADRMGTDFAINHISSDNLAYVIYTSGSTGKPKGVMLSNKGVVNLAGVQKSEFNLFPGRKVMQFSSLSFDASIWEIFMALLNGATLCLCDRDTVMSGEKLLGYLKNNCINVVTLPPSALSFIPDDDLPDLDILITAGEPATWSLIEKWSKGRKYYNAYGPTEATVCSAFHQCRIEESIKRLTPPIGKAISNYKLYVLDKRMQPVPVGVSGELHIGGVGLARGYLNRPELTAEKFVPNPFAVIKGERLYKTGDLVRYL
ncbi:MAG: amino acid adenylation domain-containing protein, partial [Ignavibacteriales bacterium]